MASRAVSRGRSDSAMAPMTTPFTATNTTVMPSSRRLIELGRGGQHGCRALETAARCRSTTATPSTSASAPSPGADSKPALDGGTSTPWSRAWATMARAIGCSDRASTAAAYRRTSVGRPRRRTSARSATLRLAPRQRAGLVERHHANTGEPLQVDARLSREHHCARPPRARRRSRPASRSRAHTDRK